MPQAHKPLCLIRFWSWRNSLFSLLALCSNKNWPPSKKIKQIENCQNNMGLKGSKGSSFNAPGTQIPLSHSVLELDFPLLSAFLPVSMEKCVRVGYSMPGAFKLDHLHPFKPILFWQFSISFTFILGGQFLLPQRANTEKRDIANSRTE